jgi:DNA-binding NarL/FixJ family response regulator
VKRPRVLLADDHAEMQARIADVLKETCEVIGSVTDGWAALASYRALQPDIVVLDVEMPGLNGIEASRRIRAEDPQARIVMLSVHEDPEYVEAALAAGAKAYVFKPRLCSDLWEAMRCALEP